MINDKKHREKEEKSGILPEKRQFCWDWWMAKFMNERNK
jgi:hypothetical protein